MCTLLVSIPLCPLSSVLYDYGMLNSLSLSIWYLLYIDLPHRVPKESISEKEKVGEFNE